jgi:hypothetical protein
MGAKRWSEMIIYLKEPFKRVLVRKVNEELSHQQPVRLNKTKVQLTVYQFSELTKNYLNTLVGFVTKVFSWRNIGLYKSLMQF